MPTLDDLPTLDSLSLANLAAEDLVPVWDASTLSFKKIPAVSLPAKTIVETAPVNAIRTFTFHINGAAVSDAMQSAGNYGGKQAWSTDGTVGFSAGEFYLYYDAGAWHYSDGDGSVTFFDSAATTADSPDLADFTGDDGLAVEGQIDGTSGTLGQVVLLEGSPNVSFVCTDAAFHTWAVDSPAITRTAYVATTDVITINDYVDEVILISPADNPTAALSLTFPTNAWPGQAVIFTCLVAITSFTMNGTTVILGGFPAALVAGDIYSFRCISIVDGSQTWIRIA